MKKHRDIPAEYCLKSVTISMEPSGKYYASLLYEKTDCENQAEEFDYENAKILGIDYAMHGMAVFSEDIQKENEGYFRKSEERLAIFFWNITMFFHTDPLQLRKFFR